MPLINVPASSLSSFSDDRTPSRLDASIIVAEDTPVLGLSRRDVLIVIAALAFLPVTGYLILHRPALLVAFVLIGSGLVLPMWVPLLVALAAAWMRVLFPGLAAGLEISDVALAVFLCRWAFEFATRELPTQIPAATKWLIVFFLWAWVAMELSHGAQVPALGRVTLYGLVFVAASLTPGLARPTFIGTTAILVGQMIAATAGWTQLGTSMTGFVGDPHQFGELGMASLAGAQLFRRRSSRLLLSSLSIAAMIFSFRRGIWIAGTIETGVILFAGARRRWQRVSVGLAGAAILAILVFWFQQAFTPELGLEPGSLSLRVVSWQTGVALVSASPWIGSGWSAALPVGGAVVPYNLWINVAASLGIPAAILLAGFFLSLLHSFVRSAGAVATAAFAYLLAFLVLSLSEMTVYAAAPGTIAFFVLMGTAVAETSPVRGFERRRGSRHAWARLTTMSASA
jgi:hypothetical protein